MARPSPRACPPTPSWMAQAQLVGWLEGLFHGIQATLMAQQMAARAQLEECASASSPGPRGGRARGTPDAGQLPLGNRRCLGPPGVADPRRGPTDGHRRAKLIGTTRM